MIQYAGKEGISLQTTQKLWFLGGVSNPATSVRRDQATIEEGPGLGLFKVIQSDLGFLSAFRRWFLCGGFWLVVLGDVSWVVLGDFSWWF